MAIKAVIFDMDGTIINTEPVWLSAAENLLKKRSISLDTQEQAKLQNALHGAGLYNISTYIKETFDLPETVEQLCDEQQSSVEDIFDEKIVFIDGFKTFIKKVIDCNLARAIATNTGIETVKRISNNLGLEQYFNGHMYTITHVNLVGKPSPDVYLYAAHKLGYKPSECIAIEDSLPGVTAAQNAGMFCIGINSSGNKQNIAHADLVVEGYHEINLQSLL